MEAASEKGCVMTFKLRSFMLVLGLAVAAPTLPADVARADEATHRQVEQLMPQLMSKDDAVRKDAERQLFALGTPGRLELERIACDEATQRVATALRLLRSRDWPDRATRGMGPDAEPVSERMRGALDDLQRRMDEFGARGGAEHTPFEWPDGATVRAKSSGEILENGRRLTWTLDEDGSVKVTTKDGKDVAERTFEAKSLAELCEKNPDVAKRLEAVLPRSVRRMPSRGTAGDGRAPFEPQPVLGIEWSPLPDVLGSQLDVRSGMVVENVVAGTLAERLGLRRHDVLLELDGKSVTDSADVRAALEPVKTGDKVAAVVLRAGKRTTLDAAK
jgi:hypothetical protein